jgi:hypothetical protein
MHARVKSKVFGSLRWEEAKLRGHHKEESR